GIRDFHVTGVQTCALPIYIRLTPTMVQSRSEPEIQPPRDADADRGLAARLDQRRIACIAKQTAIAQPAHDSRIGHELVTRLKARSDERRVGQTTTSRTCDE